MQGDHVSSSCRIHFTIDSNLKSRLHSSSCPPPSSIEQPEVDVSHTEHWDVAVVGVGTIGSMALWSLAKRGVRVIGFERHGIGHDLGAAGGESRMFRVAYKEGSWYVPLLLESARLWRELETTAGGARVLTPGGALTIGRPDHDDVAAVLHSAKEWDLDHEVLDAADAQRRFPQHRLFDGEILVADRQGGVLDAPRAIRSAVGLARSLGGTVLPDVTVTSVRQAAGHVEIVAGGEIFRATKAIVSLGPWTATLLPDLAARFDVLRVVLHWFDTENPASFTPERFPAGLRRSGPEDSLSFFPALGGSKVKINLHVQKTKLTDPARLSREVEPEYSARVAAAVARLFSGLRREPVRATAYMEGYTPDNNGLIGYPDDSDRITVLAGFSGHGFKLAPVLGEIGADLVLEGGSSWPTARLALARPGAP
jgi:sarcosine oxidase